MSEILPQQWQLLLSLAGLLLTFIGGVAGVGKYILAQMDKRLDERFKAQEKTRETERDNWSEKFAGIEGQLSRQEQARTDGQQRWQNQFDHIENQLAEYRERIGRLEEQVRASPTHDDLGELHEKVNDVGDKVSELVGEFRGANRSLQLIHSFLLNGGGNNA